MVMQAPTYKDSWIETGRGRMLARCWHAQQGGSAPACPSPVVLFHDSLGCVQLWRTFPAVLAAHTGRPVIAYDRLGFGQSGLRTDHLGPGFIGEEAQRFFPLLREQLGFDRFIAFGHSVGGGMAVHCAATQGTACAALITESAQTFVEARTRAGILAAQALFRQPQQLEKLQRYHGEKTRWVLDAWIGTWLSPAFADWSLHDALAHVRCPTLILHGSEDEYGSNLHPELIARTVSGPAQLDIWPDTRHVPHREHEQRVARRVAAFLATHCRG